MILEESKTKPTKRRIEDSKMNTYKSIMFMYTGELIDGKMGEGNPIYDSTRSYDKVIG